MKGVIIKVNRKLKGMTQPQLAKKIGVSKSVIGFWERGEQDPTPERQKQLRQVLLS